MNKPANLSIESKINSDGKTLLLLLAGDIDVTAGSVLEVLPEVPTGYKVILDFEAVGRVNSMGLAQLMRCLEDWKTSDVPTEAINLNRMVSMLFKMTGLNRYFGGNEMAGGLVNSNQSALGSDVKDPTTSDKAPRNRSSQFRRVKRRSIANEESTPEMPNHGAVDGGVAKSEVVSTLSINDKMTFAVSLQSNQQLTGWYFLNTLLQRHLGRPISMDINQLSKSGELHENAIVFAKPFDACSLITNHGYIPVVRPSDDTVEVSIVVRSEDSHKLITDFGRASVATSTNESFVFLLGRFFCDEYELDSSKLRYQFTGNQLAGIRRLLTNEVDMLFIQKENYQLLSRLSREGTHLLEESETGMAYHMLLLSPAFISLQTQLVEMFLGLQDNKQGAQTLQDLGVESWCKPEQDEIDMLLMLYNRYVVSGE